MAFSKFEKHLLESNRPLSEALLFLLTWIASSDGKVDQKELEFIFGISDSHKVDIDVNTYLDSCRNLDAIRLACKIAQDTFAGEKAYLFIQMIIGIVIADGQLATSENYILRFLASVVGLTAQELNKAFRETASRPLPEPADPSRREWWEKYEQAKRRQHKNERSRKKSETKKSKALAVLGLEDTASPDEIKKTFQRLAKVHHPDRFACLGEEAVCAATQTFVRIKEAYEYLVTNA